MKKLLPILCFLIVSSCSNDVKEVDINETVMINGIVYDQSVPPYNGVPLTGILVEYFENGQLKQKGNHKDGEQDGSYETYDENGQLKQKGNHKDGEWVGLLETYHENGQLELKGNLKDGKEHGLFNYFNQDGEPTSTKEWKDGVLQE